MFRLPDNIVGVAHGFVQDGLVGREEIGERGKGLVFLLEGGEAGLEGLLLGAEWGEEGGVVGEVVVEGLGEGAGEGAEEGVFLWIGGDGGGGDV